MVEPLEPHTSMPSFTGIDVFADAPWYSSGRGNPLVEYCWFGTGSSPTLLGGGVLSIWFVPAVTPATDEKVSPSAMLAEVRDAFGLNVTQAARVFHVERPTIYLWMTQEDSVRLRPQKRARMEHLYRLAQEWKTLGRLPNNALEAVFEKSPTLLALLSADVLNVSVILAHHHKLEASRGSLKAEQRQKAREAAKALGQAVSSIGKPSAAD